MKEETQGNESGAERAERMGLIDGRIVMRYEELTGRMPDDNCMKLIRELPLPQLRQLADELDRAAPLQPGVTPQAEKPKSIILRICYAYKREREAAERADFDAAGPPAEMDMDPG